MSYQRRAIICCYWHYRLLFQSEHLTNLKEGGQILLSWDNLADLVNVVTGRRETLTALEQYRKERSCQSLVLA